MAYIFHMLQKIGDDIISERDFTITKLINIDGVQGVSYNQGGNIRDPLHQENEYRLARFSCTDTAMNAILASLPDIIEIGDAGASTVTTPKITTLTEKITGWYFEITQYPVSGSTTNATIKVTIKWGENIATGNFPDTRTYTPQSTTFKLAFCSRHHTISGTEKNYIGFLLCPVGGDWVSSATTNRCFCGEESLYGKQNDPIPQTPTHGGGGFGTYNNTTDVTVNLGAKSSNFLSGLLGSGFNLYYVPSYRDLIRAAYYSLNGVNNLSDFFNNTAALFLSPSTYIVSATAMPADKSIFGAGAMQTTIRLGGLVSFNVDCYPLSSVWGDSDIFTYNFDPLYYDSFMDFEPFTKVTLFLPYIGFVPLKSSECIGGSVSVQYRFECLSGKCIAFVKCTDRNGRNTGFYQYSGSCGFALPWVGNNGGGSQMLHSAAAAAVSVAKGDKDSMQNVGAFGLQAAQFLAHDSRPHMQGGFGVNSGALGADEIVIFVQRMQNAMPDNYYDIHGYQTATGGTVVDYSGYTQFAYVELTDCDATDAEKAEIEQLLKGGVFL